MQADGVAPDARDALITEGNLVAVARQVADDGLGLSIPGLGVGAVTALPLQAAQHLGAAVADMRTDAALIRGKAVVLEIGRHEVFKHTLHGRVHDGSPREATRSQAPWFSR